MHSAYEWLPTISNSQVSTLGGIVDLVITRMSHQPVAEPSQPSRPHDEAPEVEQLKAAVKVAEAAAAEAAAAHEYTSGRLMEAEQRLIELEAEQDEVGACSLLLL